MKLRTKVAVATFVAALSTSAAITALFAQDSTNARFDRMRAEGKRVALSAIALYDVIRLTGSDADKATLQSFLDAAVKGNADERELAFAAVLDENKNVVASAVNANAIANAPPIAQLVDANAGDMLVVDADVVARDSSKHAADAKAGRVVVGLSTKPARAALFRAIGASGAFSLAVAFLCVGFLVVVVERRAVKPIAGVVDGLRAIKRGRLDVVVPSPGGADEAAALVDGFNDMVDALVDREQLATTLERHVGKKMARDVKTGEVGAKSGRRVRVSALFVDVEGFSERVSRDAPESVVAFVQEWVALVADIVDAHDGHVARIDGSSILAVFGVPNAHDDDAQRAVSAGHAILAKSAAVSEQKRAKREEPLEVSAGIATGDAVLATVGTKERAESVVVGEPVALARQAQEEARAASFGLLVSEETFKSVSSTYQGAATPPILVRGFGMPVTLYRVRARA